MYNRLIVFLLTMFIAALSSSCTLHFKATDLELDAKPPEASIGRNPQPNTTFELIAADLL